MASSHWDKLPENIKSLVYQFDNTHIRNFNFVIEELDTEISRGRRGVDGSRYTKGPSKIIEVFQSQRIGRFLIYETHYLPHEHNDIAGRMNSQK